MYGQSFIKKTRSETLIATRKAKRDSFFLGKKFKIVEELHLEGNNQFKNPFGYKGRNGVIIQNEADPSEQYMVGATLLKRIAEEYGAVELPEKKRKRRTKAQIAEDNARELP